MTQIVMYQKVVSSLICRKGERGNELNLSEIELWCYLILNLLDSENVYLCSVKNYISTVGENADRPRRQGVMHVVEQHPRCGFCIIV